MGEPSFAGAPLTNSSGFSNGTRRAVSSGRGCETRSAEVKKVRSRQKLAETTPGMTLASMQLAQAEVYYYGYWVYDDLTDYYYWFPADYVIVDSSWVEYVA